LQTIGDLELRNREQIEALSKGYALLTKIAARKALLDGVSIVSRTEIAATLKNITEVFNDTFGLDAEDSPK
jgi:hypothetical protein